MGKINRKSIKNISNKCSEGGGNFSCRHPKLWKYIKSNVKAFFIGGAISFVVTASATVILHSRQVRYKNDKSVERAINELYEKAEQCYDEDGIPLTYTKLEYLESTGTQYIDTDIIPKGTLKSQLKLKTNGNSTVMYYGTRIKPQGVPSYMYESINYRLITYGGMFLYDMGYGDSSYSPSSNRISSRVVLNTIYELELGNRYIKNLNDGSILAENTVLDNSKFNYSSEYTIKIFSTLPEESSGGNGVRIYYCRIYDNDSLIRDYVPVLDSKKAPCLFDKVSKTCFYNQGTGEFLYG